MRAALGMMAAAVLWTACGGGENNPGGGNAMTASIDGQAFSSSQLASASAASSSMVSVYTIIGARLLSGTTAQSISLSLYNIAGPGTYPLGVNSTNFGGIGTVAEGATAWTTPLSGAAGTVNITSLTPTRIAGTFSFNAAE